MAIDTICLCWRVSLLQRSLVYLYFPTARKKVHLFWKKTRFSISSDCVYGHRSSLCDTLLKGIHTLYYSKIKNLILFRLFCVCEAGFPAVEDNSEVNRTKELSMSTFPVHLILTRNAAKLYTLLWHVSQKCLPPPTPPSLQCILHSTGSHASTCFRKKVFY